MSSVSKGNELEDIIQYLYQKILEAEGLKNVKVQKKVTLTTDAGYTSEFDIYWEFEVAGLIHKVAIECKNYSSCVGKGDVHEFANKLDGFKDIRGIMVTKVGYQKGAIGVAKQYKISLKLLKSVDEVDWTGHIKDIEIDINAIGPLEVKAKFVIHNEYLNGRPESVIPKVIDKQTNNVVIFDENDKPITSFSEIIKSLEDSSGAFGTRNEYVYKNANQKIFIHDTNGQLLQIDEILFEYTRNLFKDKIIFKAKDYITAFLLDSNDDEPPFILFRDGQIKKENKDS